MARSLPTTIRKCNLKIMFKLLVIDDEPEFLASFTLFLHEKDDFTMATTDSLEQLPEILIDYTPDCILIDYKMTEQLSVIGATSCIRSFGIEAPIILISQYDVDTIFDDVERVKKLLQMGVRIFLKKTRIRYAGNIWLEAIAFAIKSEQYISKASMFGQSLNLFGKSLAAHQYLSKKVEVAVKRLEKLETLFKNNSIHDEQTLDEIKSIRIELKQNITKLEQNINDNLKGQSDDAVKNIYYDSNLTAEQIIQGVKLFDHTDELSNFLNSRKNIKNTNIDIGEAISSFITKLNDINENQLLSDAQIKFLSNCFVSLASNLSELHQNIISSKLTILQYAGMKK